MTPNPLSELQPIALPPEPGIWPLAIGWWLLIIILVFLVYISVATLVKRRKFWAVKRQGLSQARTLTDHSQLNHLLKRVALHYYPAHRVAGLNGQGWSDFLNQGLAGEHHRHCDEICATLYQRPAPDQDQRFQHITVCWLSGLSRKKIEDAHHA